MVVGRHPDDVGLEPAGVCWLLSNKLPADDDDDEELDKRRPVIRVISISFPTEPGKRNTKALAFDKDNNRNRHSALFLWGRRRDKRVRGLACLAKLW